MNKPIPAIIRFREELCYPVGSSGENFVLKGNIGREELESFLASELLNERERIARDICTMLDKIESQDENQSTEQWKHYKGIRNAIRDKYVLKSEKEGGE